MEEVGTTIVGPIMAAGMNQHERIETLQQYETGHCAPKTSSACELLDLRRCICGKQDRTASCQKVEYGFPCERLVAMTKLSSNWNLDKTVSSAGVWMRIGIEN